MRIFVGVAFPLVLLLAFTGCRAVATRNAAEFAPMPIGETAASVVAPATFETTAPVWFDAQWTRADGSAVQVVFRIAYRTRVGQEVLVAECVRANWAAASDGIEQICDPVFAGGKSLRMCEQELALHLTEALFPCIDGHSLATVTRIVWQ